LDWVRSAIDLSIAAKAEAFALLIYRGDNSVASAREDFTTSLMNDMDPALLNFIKSEITSFVKWDVLKFFHQNPNTTDTAENLAKYIGRDEQSVELELGNLLTSGLVTRRLLNNTPIYTVTDNELSKTLMSRFVEACEDRHFRVKAVYHILRGINKKNL
jgi:hypothetical protein